MLIRMNTVIHIANMNMTHFLTLMTYISDRRDDDDLLCDPDTV